MSSEEEDYRRVILKKIKTLNEFIRQMEDFAKNHGIEIKNERIYLIACAQRKLLRELIGIIV